MKLKYRLSLIVTAMTVVFIATMGVMLLMRARALQTESAFDELTNLSDAMGQRVRVQFETAQRTISTLANIFNGYKNFAEELRRPITDECMKSTLETMPQYISIYTVWRPGALGGDPNDNSRIYTRQSGRIENFTLAEFAPEDYRIIQASLTNNRMTEYITDPYSIQYQGKTIWLVRMFSPIIANGQVDGVVGAEVNITDIQDYIASLKPYGAGFVALNTNTGIIAGHSDQSLIGTHFQDQGIFTPQVISQIENAVKTGDSAQITFRGNLIASAALTIGTFDNNWGLFVIVPLKVALEDVRELTVFTIILAVIMIIIADVVIYLIASGTVKPIVAVAEALKDISEGEGDLTHTIPEKGNDEITEVAHYFNRTFEKIKNMVSAIKEQTVNLADMGNELSATMTESAASVNEITANIQSMKGQVLNQNASVSESNATMEQMTGTINKLNKQVERQSASVSRSSSSIEEMLANIQSVIQTLHKNAGNVANLLESSEKGRVGLREVADDIREVALESEGLLEINKVMGTIASQTNLLSMNAAIEAAHAGESGKGFAVVADEIRKLAESSSKQSKTISTVLKKIKVSIDKITASTDSVLQKFETIENGVQTVSDQESVIRSAMEEQGAGSKQILDAIEELNDVTQQVKGRAQEMQAGSKEIIQESRNLGRVTEEITNGMHEMSTGIEQINAASNRINDLCGKNRENISLLVTEISRFKVV